MKMQRKLNLISYAMVWSLIIGMLTAWYLNLVNWVIHQVWEPYLTMSGPCRLCWPFIVCIPLGLLIGYLNKWLGNYPLTIEGVLVEVRMNGRINYQNWWKSFVLGLLVLGAGGSVGPEASTSVLTGGMINWLGDRLRWASSQEDAQLWRGKMSAVELDSAPRFSDLFRSKRWQQLTVFFLVLVGTVGATIVFMLFPEEGVFGIHHQNIDWQWVNLLSAIPALIIGVGFGWFFVHLENWAAIVVNIRLGKVLQGGLFGLLLAISSLFSMDILFSGEFRIVPFTKDALDSSIVFLLLIAIVKAVMSNLGFAMGWRGGTIFPAIFASVAIGAASALLLPGDPHVTTVVVLAASLTFILERPLLTIILLALLVAVELVPVIVIVCFLVGAIVKRLPKVE